jgi:hypothetical protein
MISAALLPMIVWSTAPIMPIKLPRPLHFEMTLQLKCPDWTVDSPSSGGEDDWIHHCSW